MRKRIKSLIVTAVATVMAISSLSAVGTLSKTSVYAASGGANGSSDGIGHNSGASAVDRVLLVVTVYNVVVVVGR